MSETGSERTTLLYVGGFGRSGSTLLECLFSRLEGVVALGEVEHLWQRGVRENQLCACGRAFHDCPHWRAVGSRAFGGWDSVDVERVLSVKDAVARQRRLPRTVRRRPAAELRPLLAEFAGYHRAIYDAAREETGASVVVDSSKFPPMAVALAHDDLLDLRVVHVVRDARGVAYSWSKTVARPETATGEPMPRYSPGYATGQWLSHNLAIAAVPHLARPVTRVRYEDLVEDAAGAVRAVWTRLGLPGDGVLPMTTPRSIELVATHSVAGNPMRFRSGVTTLRPDEQWRTEMADRDRRIVTALSLPLLQRYGYLSRG